MIVIRLALIVPSLATIVVNEGDFLSPELSDFQYAMLILSIIGMAAAAYVINDYYDRETDKINKPSKVVIGVKIHEKDALIWFYGLNAMSLGLGLFLAFRVDNLRLFYLFIVSVLVNWLYAKYLKKIAFVGNLAVSVSLAMVIWMPFLFEPVYFAKDLEGIDGMVDFIRKVILWTSVAALLLNLIREIVKDLQDEEGDRVMGCKTLPIAIGISFTVYILQVLTFGAIGGFAYLMYRFYLMGVNELYWLQQMNVYLGLCLLAPAVALFVALFWYKKFNKNHWAWISHVLKLMMLLGLFSLLFFKHYLES
jgi:4-hydroxybenzoate polyprenyltransferase